MKLALIGLGRSGAVTAACLAATGHQVVAVDPDAARVAAINRGCAPVTEPDLNELVDAGVRAGRLRATHSVSEALSGTGLSFVCVETPPLPDGGVDLGQVREVICDIGAALGNSRSNHGVVIRSTVPPGTTNEVLIPLLEAVSGRAVGPTLQVLTCPDFLREGTAVADFFAPPLVVIGGVTDATQPVRELFESADCPVYLIPTREAESIRYACNAFEAVKLSYANELARLCRLLGVDSRKLLEIIAPSHRPATSANPRPGLAFSDPYVAKDLRSLLHLGRTNRAEMPVLAAALSSKELVIRELADRVLLAVEANGADRRVALLGLSRECDDLREDPGLALAEILLSEGVDVRLHNPTVNRSPAEGLTAPDVTTPLPHLLTAVRDYASDALEGVDVAVVATADHEVTAALLRARPEVVFDLDGHLGAEIEALEGYEGMGW